MFLMFKAARLDALRFIEFSSMEDVEIVNLLRHCAAPPGLAQFYSPAVSKYYSAQDNPVQTTHVPSNNQLSRQHKLSKL